MNRNAADKTPPVTAGYQSTSQPRSASAFITTSRHSSKLDLMLLNCPSDLTSFIIDIFEKLSMCQIRLNLKSLKINEVYSLLAMLFSIMAFVNKKNIDSRKSNCTT